MLCWFLFFSLFFLMEINSTTLLLFIGSDQSVAMFNWTWSTAWHLCIRIHWPMSFWTLFSFVDFFWFLSFSVSNICSCYLCCRVPLIEDYGVRWSVLNHFIRIQIRKEIMLVSSMFHPFAEHFYCLKLRRFLCWSIWYWLFFWPNLWFILGLVSWVLIWTV